MSESKSEAPSPQEQQLFDTAHRAAEAYSTYSRSQVEKIVKAVAAAAADKAEFYAEWAVRETGFGDVPSKTIKNLSNSSETAAAHDIADYVEPKVDHENKIVSFPKPAGVIVALIPSTNPVATVFYKAICALMTRNAVIMCPHPGAKECSAHAVDLMEEVAVAAGAPKGLIQSLRQPSVPMVNRMMQSDRTSLILATGGPAMVRAAYSSSNPAIGVGAGNVACYVHSSADLAKTAEHIVSSVGYDNSLPCTCESVVIADREIGDALATEMQKAGAHHVENPEELSRLRTFLFPEGKMNPQAIGKSAEWIAQRAGIQVPAGTKALGVEIFTIGREEPISKEKMFPLVGFIKVDGGVQAAIRTALAMLVMHGKGHSAVIHARDPEVVARYGDAVPVCRISVNAPGVSGSSGVATNLTPGPIIGTGFFGRSSVSENVGPKHLIQWTHVAYHKDPSEVMGDMDGAVAKLLAEAGRKTANTANGNVNVETDQLRALIKEVVSDELRNLLRA